MSPWMRPDTRRRCRPGLPYVVRNTFRPYREPAATLDRLPSAAGKSEARDPKPERNPKAEGRHGFHELTTDAESVKISAIRVWFSVISRV